MEIFTLKNSMCSVTSTNTETGLQAAKCWSNSAGWPASLENMGSWCFWSSLKLGLKKGPLSSLTHVLQRCCLSCWVTPTPCVLLCIKHHLQFLVLRWVSLTYAKVKSRWDVHSFLPGEWISNNSTFMDSWCVSVEMRNQPKVIHSYSGETFTILQLLVSWVHDSNTALEYGSLKRYEKETKV